MILLTLSHHELNLQMKCVQVVLNQMDYLATHGQAVTSLWLFKARSYDDKAFLKGFFYF